MSYIDRTLQPATLGAPTVGLFLGASDLSSVKLSLTTSRKSLETVLTIGEVRQLIDQLEAAIQSSGDARNAAAAVLRKDREVAA